MIGVIATADGTITVTGRDGNSVVVPIFTGENAMNPSSIEACSVDIFIAFTAK